VLLDAGVVRIDQSPRLGECRGGVVTVAIFEVEMARQLIDHLTAEVAQAAVNVEQQERVGEFRSGHLRTYKGSSATNDPTRAPPSSLATLAGSGLPTQT
jgi:hypothetical protein